MYTLAIALGANQGNREQNLKEAGKKLSFFIEDLVFSSVYETEPVGYQQQPWFLNQVCLGKTSHFPLELLFELKAIEKELGRVPGPRFGPRLLDLDILFYCARKAMTVRIHGFSAILLNINFTNSHYMDNGNYKLEFIFFQ